MAQRLTEAINEIERPLRPISTSRRMPTCFATLSQRAKDGYINATAMCKAAGRHFKHYNENATTKAFVTALAAEVGIPTSELIQSVSGGVPELQGTWAHPQVAIHLAQWLSPQFAVQVTQWVFEWISGGPKVVERLPYHLRRYVANMTVVPRTHFSILQELTYGLIAPMGRKSRPQERSRLRRCYTAVRGK